MLGRHCASRTKSTTEITPTGREFARFNIDDGRMAGTETLARTATRSAQLIAASERTTLDPFVEVDWAVPIDDSAYHLPPEWLPLYGTAVWESMDTQTR